MTPARPFLAPLLALALSLCLVPAQAAGWLIATPSESIRAGERLTLDAVRPDAAPWPERLRLTLADADSSAEIELLAEAGDHGADGARRRYAAPLPEGLAGLVRAELAGLASNRIALVVAAADPVQRMGEPGSAPALAPGATPLPVEEPALSANEPMYFVVGSRGGANARFQLSFKYRLFEPAGAPVQALPFLRNLHFGYTQSAVWDLGADSKPFRDTSYRPSLFWQQWSDGAGLKPRLLRYGYEHESNGKDGANSRSIDTLFVMPVWRREFEDGTALAFAPKLYGYLDRAENTDIGRYRGNVDWNFRYGKETGWLLMSQIRRGSAGHASGQFDLSYPLRDPISARTGGFLHFQLFTGYGESLLDYNQKRSAQLRVGFSIVR